MRGASADSVTRNGTSTGMRLCMIAWLLTSLLARDTLAMIYVEDVSGAIRYDRWVDALMPMHFLTQTSLGESTSMSTSENATIAPSFAPSDMSIKNGRPAAESDGNSTVFHRGLSVGSDADQDNFHNYIINNDVHFDDLLVINSSEDYVYYDSKQARFGTDLGPPGSFLMVNLMLPPRGLWGAQPAHNSHQADADQPDTNHTLRRYQRFMQTEKNYQSIDQFLGLENDTTDNNNRNATATATTQTLVVDQQQTTLVNDIFDDQHQQSFIPNDTSTSGSHQRFNSTNQTMPINISSQETSPTFSSLPANNGDNIDNSWDQSFYLSDYFCLEDFIEWRKQQRKYNPQQERRRRRQQQQPQEQQPQPVRADDNETSHKESNYDNSSSYESPSQTTIPPCFVNNSSILNDNITNSSSFINSTRPITILVRRGRCPFESKAQMAMLLNAMFIRNGKSNRISHLIVYNNDTQDNDGQGGEKLIEMGLISQTTSKGDEKGRSSQDELEETGYEVGMLYITRRSGHDLIQRIKERERSTGVWPYLDVYGVVSKDSSENGRQLRGNSMIMIEKSTQDNGEYNNSIHSDIQTTHDPLLTNGWFFPATLTRFCLSCGPGQNYGFGLALDPEDADTSSYEEWINGLRPPQDYDGPNNEDSANYYSGSYNTNYIPEQWIEAVRKLMISVLAVLLIGPFIFAVWRWHSVGGTVRITTDENGTRRLRLIAPNLEVFVNGAPGAVEGNGTKLDRAQVFALPEMEFVTVLGEDGGPEASAILREISGDDSLLPEPESEHASASVDSAVRGPQEPIAMDLSPPTPSSSFGDCLESGLFVSSTCCSICIDEFVHGERVRILPRCNHAFHTECILPWLTERQGCCPLCKTKVLPEELQRRKSRRSNSSPRIRIMRSLRQRVYQPQSTPVHITNEVSDIAVPVTDELEHDLVGSPQQSSFDGDVSEQSQHLDHQQYSVNDDLPLRNEEMDAEANSGVTQNISATGHSDSSQLRETVPVTIDNIVSMPIAGSTNQASSIITNYETNLPCAEEDDGGATSC
ncbi:hypothetical protein ACHAWX_005344 [Stephanocyclus meneghinianus]